MGENAVQYLVSSLENSLRFREEWSLLVAVLGVIIGVALMPALIFYAGSQALGLYEGATVGHLYSSLFQGIKEASIAAWIVVLGPYGLYLLFRGLQLWWRSSAKLA